MLDFFDLELVKFGVWMPELSALLFAWSHLQFDLIFPKFVAAEFPDFQK